MAEADEKEEWIERVRTAMAAKEPPMSIRGLARLIAEQEGTTIETSRRKLSKWLSPATRTLPFQPAQEQLSKLLRADLRVSRRSNWEILEDRLGSLEDSVDVLIEGQQDGLSRQESMATWLASLVGTPDAEQPAKPRQRRRTRS